MNESRVVNRFRRNQVNKIKHDKGYGEVKLDKHGVDINSDKSWYSICGDGVWCFKLVSDMWWIAQARYEEAKRMMTHRKWLNIVDVISNITCDIDERNNYTWDLRIYIKLEDGVDPYNMYGELLRMLS